MFVSCKFLLNIIGKAIYMRIHLENKSLESESNSIKDSNKEIYVSPYPLGNKYFIYTANSDNCYSLFFTQCCNSH